MKNEKRIQVRALQALTNFASSDERSDIMGGLEERELPAFWDYLADEYPEERNKEVRAKAIELFNLISI